ncbi:Hypothetical protein, putative [Bodo saltans]|nr:Hypothetical protein, putative [Bodo saltans]|eukprot:CUF99162.1 Hypothetical protein, putative [Bodo saltans]
MNNSLDFSHNNTLPFSLASGARSSSSSTASASGGGTMAATSTPKLTPTRGGKHSSDVLGEAHHHYHPTHVVTGLELLKVALRNSQESENIVSAPDRPEMLHEYSQTVAEEFPELMDTEPSPTSHFPTSPLLSIKHPSSGHYSFSQIPHHQSPGSEGGRSRLQPLRGGVSHTDSSPATNADPSIVRLLHNEESTRSLIREQHAGLLAGLLHRVHEQVLWYTQLELQRVTAELSQSHAMHDGATQVDHKQQLMSYARAVDECNERLVSFMKAKDSSDQECARLRGELRRAQEDSIVAKRAALQNEEAAGELRLQLSDSEERVRLLVRDRDQLSQRLRGYAEQNLLLTEQQRLFLKSGLGSVSHRHRDDVQEQGSQTEEGHLYRSTFVASSASTLLWSRGTPLHAGGGQLLATTAEESASSRQGINYDYSAPEAAQQAHAGGIAIEAASMFSPYVKDIWGSATQPVRLAQTSTPPQFVSHRQHLHPPASSPFRRDPSVASSLKAAFVATSPLKDAHARGYRSLEEWDRVLEAKAESFLHKEVEWSVKERQLLVLERELDARIKQTSRESSLLRFQLQETKSKLTLVVRVSRMLLQSRKMRQRHLMSVETAAMTIEDPLRLVASPLGGSSAATTQSTSKTKNSSSSGAPPVVSSVGTQVEKDEFQEEATGVAASSQRSGGGGSSWWSSTKDAVLSRTGTR